MVIKGTMAISEDVEEGLVLSEGAEEVLEVEAVGEWPMSVLSE